MTNLIALYESPFSIRSVVFRAETSPATRLNESNTDKVESFPKLRWQLPANKNGTLFHCKEDPWLQSRSIRLQMPVCRTPPIRHAIGNGPVGLWVIPWWKRQRTTGNLRSYA